MSHKDKDKEFEMEQSGPGLTENNLLAEKTQYAKIYPLLVELYPTPRCGLDFQSPFQLLVATILSAQCTDERVNIVTPLLFGRFPDAVAMAAADITDIEKLIYSTGFYHNKAKNILATSQRLVAEYDGEVPHTMPELLQLAGVARKTASVVLGNAFGLNEGVAVDTHVTRLAGRLALSKQVTAEKIERDLLLIVPREEWTNVSHRLIWHGRKVCMARNPACIRCLLAPDCPSAFGGEGLQHFDAD